MSSGNNQAIQIPQESYPSVSRTGVQIAQTAADISLQFSAPQGTCVFRCSRRHGGRIVSFSLNNQEILVQPNESGMFGSTFWTAPENWGWPPPAAVDADLYTSAIDEDNGIVTLTSAIEPRLNIRIQKRFEVSRRKDAVMVDYTIINESESPQQYAPWEISRVEKGGVTFYRPGTAVLDAQNRGEMAVSNENGICAYTHPTDLTGDAKLFDSSADNWIAHTDGRLVLLKQYDPCLQPAPGEGDIEIYACPSYVEVEQQGTYSMIAPGRSFTWRVIWSLHLLPNDIDITDTKALGQLADQLMTK